MRTVRRLALFLLLALVALGAAGCSPEDPAQRHVREAVAVYLEGIGGYETGRTHCTHTPRPWFQEQGASAYVCAGERTSDGRCDWFTARLEGLDVDVERSTRNGGCVLPA